MEVDLKFFKEVNLNLSQDTCCSACSGQRSGHLPVGSAEPLRAPGLASSSKVLREENYLSLQHRRDR
eukprot:CAMPEP_0171490864 /NCGR_PEP_ID=MMETSP0958-20121227/3546_1 /TAXON_ID=87120 /ORGANISM="Aurantiochytrium limacinum, Strain ATCCMYA-1381" /LENGTH=66 /DNA_ID=CAMNT_0012024229 /DNA_START=858 /DNA_END=1059 /DNA_ORIENTATION=+